MQTVLVAAVFILMIFSPCLVALRVSSYSDQDYEDYEREFDCDFD